METGKELTLYQSVIIAENFQDWRKGANIPQPEPAVITQALKVLIATVKTVIKQKSREDGN